MSDLEDKCAALEAALEKILYASGLGATATHAIVVLMPPSRRPGVRGDEK